MWYQKEVSKVNANVRGLHGLDPLSQDILFAGLMLTVIKRNMLNKKTQERCVHICIGVI